MIPSVLHVTAALDSVVGGFDLPDLTGVAGLTLVALLTLTDKLVWHTRLERAEAAAAARLKDAEARCDRWEGIALRALGVAGQVTHTAEVAGETAEEGK